MKSEIKNGIALVTIVVLIGVAFLVPLLFNKIFDSKMGSRTKYMEDGVYRIVSSEDKSVQKRMEELATELQKEENQMVNTAVFVNENMCQKVVREYQKWAEMINKNFEIFETKFNLSSEVVVYDEAELHWDYDTGLSFYVCKGVVGDLAQGQKYEITIYVDKDTYKILYMQLWSYSLQEQVENFWNIGGKNKYMQYRLEDEKQQKVSTFIKKYYHVPDNKFEVKTGNYIYDAKMFENLDWEVSETADLGLGFGLFILDKKYLIDIQSSVGANDT